MQSQARLCRIQDCVCHGDHKCPVPKGSTYSIPVHHGTKWLKFAWGLQSAANRRAERLWETLRVLIFYWVGEDSTCKFFEVILVDPLHKAIRRNPRTQWITKPANKHREMHGLMSAGFGKSHKFHHTIGGFHFAAWRRHHPLQHHHYHQYIWCL